MLFVVLSSCVCLVMRLFIVVVSVGFFLWVSVVYFSVMVLFFVVVLI